MKLNEGKLMKIKIKKLYEGAKMPSRGTSSAAGFDLCELELVAKGCSPDGYSEEMKKRKPRI